MTDVSPIPTNASGARLQEVGVDEAGDDEDEVDGQQKHEHGGEHHQPAEVQTHPGLVLSPRTLKGEHE